MLEVRLQGEEQDIQQELEALHRRKDIEILSVSKIYDNRNSNLKRVYVKFKSKEM